MDFNCQRGSILVIALVFLLVLIILVFSSLQNSVLNQKDTSNDLSNMISFTNAEAGILAEEAKLNGQVIDLSNLPGTIEHSLESDEIDNCQQHTVIITSQAKYGDSSVYLKSAYFQAPVDPFPGCVLNNSRTLWWQQIDDPLG